MDDYTHQPPPTPTLKSKAHTNSKPKPIEISRHCRPGLSSVSLLHSNVHLRLASSGVGAILVFSEPFGLWEKKAAQGHRKHSDSGQASACSEHQSSMHFILASWPCCPSHRPFLPRSGRPWCQGCCGNWSSDSQPNLMVRMSSCTGENTLLGIIEMRQRGFIGRIGFLSAVLCHQLLTQSPTLEGSNRGALQSNSSFWSEIMFPPPKSSIHDRWKDAIHLWATEL